MGGSVTAALSVGGYYPAEKANVEQWNGSHGLK